MTQASQALPSWLTLSATTLTLPDGMVTTSFDTLRLPLTYYGPSIPLGTDGAWTYGGLSSPAPSSAESSSTSPSTQSPSSTLSVSTSPSPSPSPSPSQTQPPSMSSLSTLEPSSEPTSAPTSTPSSSPTGAATPSRGISTATLAAILGTILGIILICLIILVIFLIRRIQRRRRSDPSVGERQTTSSFWNRQTMLFTRPESRRQTPIWTEWQIVQPDDTDAGAAGQRTPGEGSPRGSGEEVDALLTRRSIRSGTVAEEMKQQKTGTDTLVSVPAAVASRGSPRTGHILPREVLSRMVQDEGDAQAIGEIRVVQPSPPLEYSPLLPPRPLDPDGVRATRAAARHSDQSLTSHKSALSLEVQEGAELLTARRVRVSDLGSSRSPSLQQDVEAGTSTSRNTLGLQGLGGRLGRLSWFRRATEAVGSSASPSSPRNSGRIDVNDPYTRTPPRTPRGPRSHSRSRSRSRPDSWIRVPVDEPDLPPHAPHDSGLGLPSTSTRPISSVSAKSASGASGGTVYHDAVSTPVSDFLEFPLPVATVRSGSGNGSSRGNGSSQGTGGNGGNGSGSDAPRQSLLDRQQQLLLLSGVSQPQPPTQVGYVRVPPHVPIPPHDPPAYDDSSLPKLRKHTRLPSDIDVLDIPAPPPASPFSSSRPAFPPGLVQLPTPRTWRDSYPSPVLSGTSEGSAGIAIDVLEEEPPLAREGWRSLATAGVPPISGEGKRTTFGTPMVVHPRGSPMNSEEGSLHSRPSHLAPYPSRSPIASARGSNHTGSNSSRPSEHSAGHSQGSHGHSVGASSSVSSYGYLLPPRRVGEIGELNPVPIASPPLSAVFPGRPRAAATPEATQPTSEPAPQDDTRSSTSSNPFVLPPIPQHSFLFPLSEAEISPSSSNMPLLGRNSAGEMGSGSGAESGTVASRDTTTNSSVTTALTDPITGSRMHVPGMPRRSGMDSDRERRWQSRWHDGGYGDWS